VAVTFQNCLVATTAQFPAPSRPLFTKKEEWFDVNNKCSSYGKERLTINPISKQDKPQLTRPILASDVTCTTHLYTRSVHKLCLLEEDEQDVSEDGNRAGNVQDV
jgi:hypothetical protein